MSFALPKVLWFGLVVAPLLAFFFWFTWRKRQELIQQFVQNRALAELALGVSRPRQIWRRVLLFVAVCLLLVGIAGPQWGFTWEEAAQRGRDIVVAIDTSRSMLATDVQPDRLTRAKLAALDLLHLGRYDRFGLIAFAGSAFLQCPLTSDDEAFRQSVQILQPGIIPQGGTALAEAIKAARDAFGTDAEDNHKVLVLFTDGEDHEANVKDEVQRAAADGVKIFTVGVGTPAGELLRIRDEQGNLVYVKDEDGNVVKSKLDEQLLREIATTGNGFYLPLQGGNAMEVLYQKGLAPLPTSERNSKLMKQLKEQFYWPLGLALLLLILEIFIPEQKRLRRPAGSTNSPTAAAAVAALLLLGFIPRAEASAARAQSHYKAGEYKSALSEYQKLLSANPNDPRLHYNAGASAYQASKFDEAMKQFQAAAGSPDLDLQQQAFYNLGNSEFRLGESDANPQQRQAVWEEAVQHYDAALKLNPQDQDALFNRDLVKKKLEELKKEQQKNQNQKKNQNNENKDQDQKDKQDQEQNNKSDQQKKDQNQQNNSSDQNKQDQEQKKNEQNKQDQQKQQEQQQKEQKSEADQQKQQGQPKQGEQKQDQANQQQGGEKKGDKQKPDQEGSAAQYAELGKMSPTQAKQLLDAQKGEEKALLFIPQESKSAPRNRVFKDW